LHVLLVAFVEVFVSLFVDFEECLDGFSLHFVVLDAFVTDDVFFVVEKLVAGA